jgi:hypothetical protein
MTIDEIIQRALTGIAASSPEAGRTAGAGMASLEYKTALVAPSVENVGSFASPQLRLGGGSREIQSADNRRRVSAPTQAAAEQAEREQAVALLEQGRMRFGRERVADLAAQSRETARLVADAAAALARQEAAHARAAELVAEAKIHPPRPDAGAAPAVALPAVREANVLARPLRARWETPLKVGDMVAAEAAAAMVLRSIRPRPDDADKRELEAALQRLMQQCAARAAHRQNAQDAAARVKAWELEVAACRAQEAAAQRELREVDAVRARLRAELEERERSVRLRTEVASLLRRLQPGHFSA